MWPAWGNEDQIACGQRGAMRISSHRSRLPSLEIVVTELEVDKHMPTLLSSSFVVHPLP